VDALNRGALKEDIREELEREREEQEKEVRVARNLLRATRKSFVERWKIVDGVTIVWRIIMLSSLLFSSLLIIIALVNLAYSRLFGAIPNSLLFIDNMFFNILSAVRLFLISIVGLYGLYLLFILVLAGFSYLGYLIWTKVLMKEE
jgi:hypothetical protein